MILHILLSQQHIITSNNDAVVLLADACYQTDVFHHNTYMLNADCKARGIKPPNNIKLIDYDELVELVAKFPKSITWN